MDHNKQSVTVKFVDFWPGFDENSNKLLDALRSVVREVEVIPAESASEADLLFYSGFGLRHLDDSRGIRIYFTGENDVPDFNECDYALSFHRLDFGPRHLRYPLYMMTKGIDRLADPPQADRDAAARPFCSFLMRNHYNCDPRRIEIVDAVEAYRPIAYGGPWRNNTGGPVDDKISFIAGYKFNLALENSVLPGYITEKIVEPLIAGTVPIYWGPDDAVSDFNPDSFIRVNDFDTPDSFISRLREIDNNPQLYLSILKTPRLNADRGLDFDSRLADFLRGIVTTRRRYVTTYGMAGKQRRTRRLLRPFAESKVFMKLARLISGVRKNCKPCHII